MAGRKRIPPLAQLQGVLSVLENRQRRPPSEILAAVGEMVRDAIAVLQEPDPLKQRLAFVLLAIQQSTEVRTQPGHQGKVVYKVKVVDQPLYAWAMAQVHEIAGAA